MTHEALSKKGRKEGSNHKLWNDNETYYITTW